MAPGSRGVGAVFVHFSGEDSDQTGDAIGEPRVPRRSWSRYLSNAPGLADQLVASRKDSAREGGSPDVRFRRSWYRWKACAAYFCKVPDLRKSELGLVRYGPANRGHRSVFGPFEGSFPIGIPASPDQLVASQEDSARKRGNVGGKIPEPSAKPYFVGLFSRAWPCAEASLGSQDMILRTEAVGMFLMPRVHLGLRVDPSGVQMDIPRVENDQTRCGEAVRGSKGPFGVEDSDRRSVFAYTSYRDGLAWVTTQVSNRGRIGLGDHPGLETKFVIRVRIGLGDHPGLETETNRGRIGLGDHPGLETKFVIRVRIGLGDHPGLETETNRGRIGLGDHPGLETKFVIRVRIGLGDHPGLETETNRGRIGLGDHPGLETETNRGRIGLGDHPGLETKFVIRVRIGLGDHPGLETETNRGRIGLGDHPGLETKFVIRVRIGLGDHPGLETETNRGRIGLGDHPGLETKFVIRVRIGLGDHPGLETETNRGRIGLGDHPGLETKFVIRHFVKIMSDRGSGSGGPRRSDRLAKGKAVLYEPDSPPDTDDEYDAMEDLLVLFGLLPGLVSLLAVALDPPVRLVSLLRRRQLLLLPDRRGGDLTALLFPRIPYRRIMLHQGSDTLPRVAFDRAIPVTTPVVDTSLLTGLHSHPSSSVRRCEDPPESIGRGGWSEFCQLLEIARPEYRDFLVELGFGPFLSIRYVHVRHPLVRCWVERFFHHTGTIHLSTCEMGVLPVDWSAILGIRFGGIDDPAAVVGKKLFYLKISYLRDLLVREIEEPPTELRYRQWTAYFIFSCFLGNDKSTIPTPIVGMFRDIDDLRDYDWGALTYGFYIRGLRRFSSSRYRQFPQLLAVHTFLGLRAFRRMPTSSFQPYSTFLLERPEVFRAMELSRLRIWIRSPRSWELLMGERTLRQLGWPGSWADQLWTAIFSSPSGEFERLQTEILRLQLELSVSEDRYVADMDRAREETARVQTELTQVQGELTQVQGALTQSQRRLGFSRCGADCSRGDHSEIRGSASWHGALLLVTGAGSSGLGQTSSSPPPDPVSRDWFFDDPPSL
uniref:Aminotransferase-like plant mobile domain-containing protein n=1 Tax=Fagus sylvatica TaxID=28930 RepID=A0A2N9GNY4_FAGSY